MTSEEVEQAVSRTLPGQVLSVSEERLDVWKVELDFEVVSLDELLSIRDALRAKRVLIERWRYDDGPDGFELWIER